ncbi:MAG: ATP-dependent RNA helicase [Nanoarchaeota archaeon]|nr:ATP-dependent RNA helicase [Nanoarchaeota archaeon]|tara:strand:- start:2970 stop:4259 length:1290 start_codon:yes stop_codon:yes gene_type:complete
MKFSELQVREEIVSALQDEQITEPTNIQEQTIPLALAGKDIVGSSRTGSGKTLSFGVPLIQRVESGKGVQGLVLAPTRELANQISRELRKWSKNINLNIATVFGGVALGPQVDAMRRSEIIVATPGRMLDHMGRNNVDLGSLKCFVLDEADKMVEMGFIEDIERILQATPEDRQILLFGATISDEINYIKQKHMKDVQTAKAELHVKKDLLEQQYYNVKMFEKFSLLVHLLKKEETGRVIIFCSKRSTVELVNRNLRDHSVKSEMIHGKMRQNKRLNVIDRFNNGKVDILVASSVAARGLDIKNVTHIFNYDLSKDPQEYIHRVGRTARAGESGTAITLLAEQDYEPFHAILGRYGMEVEELQVEAFEKLRFNTQQERRGSRNGFRGQRNGQRTGGFRGQGSGSRPSGQRSDFRRPKRQSIHERQTAHF